MSDEIERLEKLRDKQVAKRDEYRGKIAATDDLIRKAKRARKASTSTSTFKRHHMAFKLVVIDRMTHRAAAEIILCHQSQIRQMIWKYFKAIGRLDLYIDSDDLRADCVKEGIL